jgi:hypothetical protein
MSNKVDTLVIKRLISDTKRIVKHQDELSKLKGEHFNVFSILKMESKENETHSAFLGELLNPHGSHLMGSVFLSLFLQKIGDDTINVKTAKLFLEFSVGANNHTTKTGGRIDIYIRDDANNSLSIENKIYAGDQYAQLKRYSNHNKSKNTVYYLTLYGEDATKESKLDLKIDEDYYCLSYDTNIIDWLEACIKEATEQPILRETIKQYIILLKKLTNQLSNKEMENEIKEIIQKNYSAAKYIESGIKDVELDAINGFLRELKTALENQLGDNWKVNIDKNISISWKGLELAHKSWGDGISIKLEGQSKLPWHDSVYGVRAYDKIWDRQDVKSKLAHIDFLQSGYRESGGWPYYQNALYFSKTDERKKLFNADQRKILIEQISSKMVKLANAVADPLSNIKSL